LPVIKGIHIADLHLGTSFRYLTGQGIEELRRNDFVSNFNVAIDEALKRGVDLFIIAGDVFHRAEPTAKDFIAFTHGLGRLINNGIDVVVIAGNHDKPKSSKAKTLLEGLQALGLPKFHYIHTVSREPKPLIIEKGGVKVGIAPLPYVDPRLVKDFDVPYQAFIRDKVGKLKDHPAISDADFKVLVAHLMIDKAKYLEIFPYFKEEPKVSLSDIHEGFFDYIALGHIHTPQKVGSRAYYSGSIERINFAEKDEDKGFIYFELGRDGGLYVEEIRLKCRPMKELSVNIEGTPNPLTALLDVIRSEVFEKGSLLKLKVIGEPEGIKTIKSSIDKVGNALMNKGIAGFYIDFITLGRELTPPPPPGGEGIGKSEIKELFIEFVKSYLRGRGDELINEVVSRGLKILQEEGLI